MRYFFPTIGNALTSALIAILVAGVFQVDTNGRITHTPIQVYDKSNGVLAYDYRLDLGAVAVPSGKQVNAFWLTGALKTKPNTRAYLNGIVFDLTNDAPTGDTLTDPTRVRAIIGQVTTTGAGSVRGIHTHAIGAPGTTVQHGRGYRRRADRSRVRARHDPDANLLRRVRCGC